MALLYIAALTLVAAAVGTATGFGTSTLMIPVLVMFFPPVEAIFLVAIIHWFGDVWKITLFRRGFNLRLLALFGAVGLATSYLGALVSLGANERVLLRLLGAFLAGYAVFSDRSGAVQGSRRNPGRRVRRRIVGILRRDVTSSEARRFRGNSGGGCSCSSPPRSWERGWRSRSWTESLRAGSGRSSRSSSWRSA